MISAGPAVLLLAAVGGMCDIRVVWHGWVECFETFDVGAKRAKTRRVVGFWICGLVRSVTARRGARQGEVGAFFGATAR